jgi:hypothetical protein
MLTGELDIFLPYPYFPQATHKIDYWLSIIRIPVELHFKMAVFTDYAHWKVPEYHLNWVHNTVI